MAKEGKSWFKLPRGLSTAVRLGYWDESSLEFLRAERGIEGVFSLLLTTYGAPWAIPHSTHASDHRPGFWELLQSSELAAFIQLLSICTGIYGVAKALYDKELDIGRVLRQPDGVNKDEAAVTTCGRQADCDDGAVAACEGADGVQDGKNAQSTHHVLGKPDVFIEVGPPDLPPA